MVVRSNIEEDTLLFRIPATLAMCFVSSGSSTLNGLQSVGTVNGIYFYSTVTVRTAQKSFLISATITTSFHSVFLHIRRISYNC